MLEFGTAGIRGIMGPGEDIINIDVVRKVTQALANFLNKKVSNPSVVISYDSRNNSYDFAKDAAGVLAGNGINTTLWPEMMPVPVLSYSVRYLKCSAGIMITASHNPKEYNGYKVYGPNGGQILEEDAKAIQNEIESVKEIKFSNAYELASSDIYDSYRKEMESASNFNLGTSDDVILSEAKNLKIVYTPLNGSGRKPVTDMLNENGYSYEMVKEQEMPDGNFTTCPSPNPEKDEVYEIALKYANKTDADIIVATDPDCDRVGCMVKQGSEYKVLSGNEIGTLMTYYLCEKSNGGTIVCSLVSTPIIERIAESFGCVVERTPVGFKYIGDKMDVLGDKFIFGFEESNGFLTGDYARDKDGVVGAKIILGMASHYKTIGKTLIDVLNDIYDKYGLVINKTISKDLKPGDLKPEMSVKNYDDGARIIIRPSGTEPKVKYYLSASSKERIEELKTIAGI